MRITVEDLKNKENLNSVKGFTLLETTIVIGIIGLILGAIIMPYNIWRKNDTLRTTDSNINLATSALSNYLIQRGRYPCPARLTAVRGDVDYGMESICDSTDPQYPSVFDPAGLTTVGTFQSGLFYEESERTDADIDPDPAAATLITPKIRRGAIPFRTLGLAEDQVEDGYGMRLQYALTENLGVVGTYVQESGGISIVNGAGTAIVTPPMSAHYLVFSTGKDMAGAYSRQGIATGIPCPVGSLDTENCNTGVGATDKKSIYLHGAYSTAIGANHFDDSLKFYSSVETPLWRVADANGLNIRDLINAEASGRLGIGGVVTPTDTLQVAGEVRTTLGDSKVEQLCNETGGDCIDTGKFGAAIPATDFQCANGVNPGAYGIGFSGNSGIAGGRMDCVNTIDFKCPPGTKVVGLKADGTMECAGAFVGCPSQNVTLCGSNTFNLPAAIRNTYPDLTSIGGTVGWTPIVGLSYKERWYCQANGTWTRNGTSGICSCTPSDITNFVSCNSVRSGNWLGTVEMRTQKVCPSGITTTTNVSDNCVCDPKQYNGTSSCPSGIAYSGGPKQTARDWVCDDPDNGHWANNWHVVLPDNYCTCTAVTENFDFSCPVAYTGYNRKERTFDCATGLFSAWQDKTPIENTCVCIGAVENKTEGCLAPLVGTVNSTRDYDCASDTWNPWVPVSNNCGAVTYTYRDKTAASGSFSGALPKSLGGTCTVIGEQVACSSPKSGGGFWHYPLCECE